LADVLKSFAKVYGLRLAQFDDDWYNQLPEMPAVNKEPEKEPESEVRRTPNGKPAIVEVTRFYRATDDYGYVISDRGVTVNFTLDYEHRKYTAMWSLCQGDNFSKEVGINTAKYCKSPISGDFNPELNLFNNLLTNVDILLCNHSLLPFHQHNLKMLSRELHTRIE
jgi:hypothetical protein